MTLGIAFVIVFLGGLIQGFSGFGYSQFTVPWLLFFFEPVVVMPIALMHSIILNLQVLFDVRKWVDIKHIWILIAGGLLGIPIGTYILLVVDVNIIRILVGIVIVVSSLIIIKGFRIKLKHEKPAFIPIGFIGGILGGSVTMSGPPVILFFSSQGVSKNYMRANLAMFFLSLNILTLPFYIAKGLINQTTLSYFAILLIALVLGTFIGIKLSRLTGEKIFRKIALFILIAIGIFCTITGIFMKYCL